MILNSLVDSCILYKSLVMHVHAVGVQIFVSVMLICIWETWAAEYKIDVILVDSSPLVGENTAEKYRAYLPWSRQSADFIEIGRTSNTGTGEVGQGYKNPGDGDSVPRGSGLPDGTRIDLGSSDGNWRRMEVQIPKSTSLNRIGVFYATTEYNSNRVTIPIIKMSETAKITPDHYTKTIGIGESVTLTVTSTVNNVRWVHNNGDIITDWNDQTEVTIDNVRLANAGIFECFEAGRREMGEHAIMRLIVRACPSAKYGQDCSSNCETCWNGGICAADNGICLCQPGFTGPFCGQRHGRNTLGASGYLSCGSGSECIRRLICGPDPIGCSCIAGYTGLDCTTACTQGWYGANCNMECHCDVDDCDNAIGCNSDNNCNAGFGNNFCQGKDVCSRGYFGKQCEFMCHCHEGEGCDQNSGVCNNGRCAYGWGGDDCQQALPYFSNNDHITANATRNSVLLAWGDWNQAIDYGTGHVDHYKIYFWKEGEKETSSQFQTSFDSSEIISDLSIESVYNFDVAAVKTVNGEELEGPRGRYISATTQCAAPTLSPSIESVKQVEYTTVKLSWKIPSDSGWIQCSSGLSGFIITYKIKGLMGNATEVVIANNQISSTEVTSLMPCKIYQFQIRAMNKDAEGNNSSPENVDVYVAPETITNVQLVENILSWDEPRSICNVTDYVVKLIQVNRDPCDQTNTQVNNTVVASSDITLPELEYFSTYKATIQARSGDSTFATSESTTKRFDTNEAAPSGQPQNLQGKALEDGQLSFTWNLPPCGSRHGKIIAYEYEYWLQSQQDAVNRENTTLEEITLSALLSNKTYVFQVRAYTIEGPGPFSEMYRASTRISLPPGSSANIAGVIGGVVGGVILLLVLLIVIVIIIRKRTTETKTKTQDNTTESLSQPKRNDKVSSLNVGYVKDTAVNIGHTDANETPLERPTPKPRAIVKPIYENTQLPNRNQPVKVEYLMEYVEVNKAGGPDHGLSKDFKALPDPEQQLFPWTAAKKPENTTKNRYKNIIPYDNSRVVLDLQDGDEHSDYINASYIDGYKKNNAYIASQGPNSATVKDHWRMIWQEGTETIVMVTRLVEVGKIKCEKYWPDQGKTISFGDYTVTNVKEEDKGLYVVRKLTLAKTDIYANPQAANNEVRFIKHFHYTGWPDMSVPEFAEPILGFLDNVNVENSTTAGPIVIHCSAGIGRTGTFITLDTMLKMAKAEGKVDIFNFVHDMRQRRPGLIQIVAQYIFVHDALLEALFCGKTTIPTSDVEHAWRAVEGAINGEDNHIRGQFQSLVSMYPALSERKCAEGKTEENLTKNRYSTCLPPDSMRPKLPTPGVEGSIDYINASFCHGHEERNMYLTTQVPLSNTVEDFWRLIYSFDFHTIVALHHPDDNNKTYGTYFPQEGSVVCGQYVVESLDIENNENTIERKLRFYMSDNPTEVITVRLVQYTDWSTKSDLPSSASSFVRLLNRVDVHRRDTDNNRVVVVDSDGVSRCGLFCAVMSIIDQIKEKQEVDVFRAVKRLKVCRHEMIKSMEQYTFCYEAARMYLQAFEEYANFM
ncbi:uncharacterized protein [Amphiura filiformis]|uniref:uncharacterized protein n=1 Tax=Amphiura filiformis TaxID=82378 RepID=UPI003B215B29